MLKKKKKEKRIKGNHGFVILFAMVISLIVVLIGSGMYTIARKKAIISSYARESQKAFYAADSALECALYHDISPYITGTSFPINAASNYTTTFSCGGNTIETRKLPVRNAVSGYTDLFSFRYPEVDISGLFNKNQFEEPGCAYVLVEKKEGESTNGKTEVLTRITAVGFNTCIEGSDGLVILPNFDDPRLLERRISSTYTTYTTQ